MPSSKYVTNQEQTVAEAVNHIEGSSKIDILASYFYFSGLKKLLEGENSQKHFLQKLLRILVGMEINSKLRAEGAHWEPEERSGREAQEPYLNGEAFDDKESLRLFFDKLEGGTLEIRKTAQPVHAKVYLFAYGSNPEAPYTRTEVAITLPEAGKFINHRYQTDAVNQAVQMILSHGGALLADVVGLGKSILASCIAKTLLEHREVDDVYIICPPALEDSWKDYCGRFGIRKNVSSSGSLEKLHENLLGRNPATNAYGISRRFAQGIGGTAAHGNPLNNTTADIFFAHRALPRPRLCQYSPRPAHYQYKRRNPQRGKRTLPFW